MVGFPSPHPLSPSNRWVVFSNPASETTRKNMAVKLSKDGCRTWSKPWIIHANASAYSDLAYFETWDSNAGVYSPNIAILYEAGIDGGDFAYEAIHFKMFSVERMLQGIQESSSLLFMDKSNLKAKSAHNKMFRGPRPKYPIDEG